MKILLIDLANDLLRELRKVKLLDVLFIVSASTRSRMLKFSKILITIRDSARSEYFSFINSNLSNTS